MSEPFSLSPSVASSVPSFAAAMALVSSSEDTAFQLSCFSACSRATRLSALGRPAATAGSAFASMALASSSDDTASQLSCFSACSRATRLSALGRPIAAVLVPALAPWSVVEGMFAGVGEGADIEPGWLSESVFSFFDGALAPFAPPSLCFAKQLLQSRTSVLASMCGRMARPPEQALHTRMPQARQWCRRVMRPNSVLHSLQLFAVLSASHTAANLTSSPSSELTELRRSFFSCARAARMAPSMACTHSVFSALSSQSTTKLFTARIWNAVAFDSISCTAHLSRSISRWMECFPALLTEP
mmetsp:Transcript_22209/g.68326  ORF Transcript_22209/g.68326 Transcript_22209/m.68326 type:complete len:301 (+) Transcript_22209:1371-2273(+)